MFVDVAHAMGQQGEGGSQGFTSFFPLILIFVIFYFPSSEVFSLASFPVNDFYSVRLRDCHHINSALDS